MGNFLKTVVSKLFSKIFRKSKKVFKFYLLILNKFVVTYHLSSLPVAFGNTCKKERKKIKENYPDDTLINIKRKRQLFLFYRTCLDRFLFLSEVATITQQESTYWFRQWPMIYSKHFNSGHNVSLICDNGIENIINNNINQGCV